MEEEHERLAKLRARRERELAAQIKAHGGTGFPPDGLTPAEACRLGICPKCSGRWDALHTHVWKHYPGLSMAQGIRAFREEFPDVVHIDSYEHRKVLAEAQLERMQGPEGEQIRANLAEKSSGPHPDRYGKTGRNPSGAVISNWEVAKLRARGRGLVEIAKKLGAPNNKLIQRRSESMGLSFDTVFLCDHGEPFRNRSIFHLRRVSGFEAKDFDRFVGLSEGRSGAMRPAESIANPEDARLVIEWRDGVVRELLTVAVNGVRRLRLGGKVYRQDEVLKTFLPELPELNRALVLTMPEILQEVRKHPEWNIDELGEFVCFQAASEKSVSAADHRWRKTLRYLAAEPKRPERTPSQWLKDNLNRLRAAEAKDVGALVREMIGYRYGATQQTVQNALRRRFEPITPLNTRMLIKEFAPRSAEAKPKMGGAPEGLRPHTRERIRRMAGLEMARPRWKQEQMAPFVFWNTPETCQENIRPFSSKYRSEIDAMKQTLTESAIQQIVREATQFLNSTHRS